MRRLAGSLTLLAQRHPGAVTVFASYTLAFVALAAARSDGRIWAFMAVLSVIYVAVAATERATSLGRGVV